MKSNTHIDNYKESTMIEVSESAHQKIKEYLEKNTEEGLSIRLFLATGG